MIAESWRAGWRRPDRRPIYEWAGEHIYLPAAYTITGRFCVESSRHLVEVFEALQDDGVWKVTLVAPVRSGKSMVADVWVPWALANDPGPVMWNMQTDGVAKDHAETRMWPILEGCAPVRVLLPEDRHKRRTQEVIFADGSFLMIQGPALGNLQSKGVRYLINDELWMWQSGRFVQAMSRIKDFQRLGCAKVLNVSQGGVTDDDLDVEARSGDMREWEVRCLGCAKYFQPEFSGFRADGSRWGVLWDEKAKDRFGDWNIGRVMESVRYACPECGRVDADEARVKLAWNGAGRYRVTNPNGLPGERSFHYPATITDPWRELARVFCAAMNAYRRGILEPLVAFTQKQEARAWSEERILGGRPSATYELQSEWPEEFARVMTIDRQAEGVHWVMVAGFSKEGLVRRWWFGKCFTEAELIAKAAEWKVQSNRVSIDSGFEAKEVYAMCVRNGWIALKGEDQAHFVHMGRVGAKVVQVLRSYSPPVKGDPERGTVCQGRRFATLIRWSNPTIKERLRRLIESGRWQEPAVDPKDEGFLEYSRQMRAEYRKLKRDEVTGRTKWVWVCPSGNNHAFDCASMVVLRGTILGCLKEAVSATDGTEATEAATVKEEKSTDKLTLVKV